MAKKIILFCFVLISFNVSAQEKADTVSNFNLSLDLKMSNADGIYIIDGIPLRGKKISPDKLAMYSYGADSLINFILNNIDKRILIRKEHSYFINFLGDVETNGSITNFQLLNSEKYSQKTHSEHNLYIELKRIFKLTNGSWIPAYKNKKPVTTIMSFYFAFKTSF